MRQMLVTLSFSTPGQGFHEITREVADWLRQSALSDGLLTLFCRHTSAGLAITENAAPAVRRDLSRWLAQMAPENAGYEHDDEGPDDMPAHIKTLLTGSSLSIPVSAGRMLLGTWQGIFVVEHRARPHRREIVLHAIGE